MDTMCTTSILQFCLEMTSFEKQTICVHFHFTPRNFKPSLCPTVLYDCQLSRESKEIYPFNGIQVLYKFTVYAHRNESQFVEKKYFHTGLAMRNRRLFSSVQCPLLRVYS